MVLAQRQKTDELGVRVGDYDLLTEEQFNRLVYWRDKMREGCFEIGDIGIECVQSARLTKQPIARQKIQASIGNVIGRSARTVRYYMDVAAFFGRDARERYDMLSFAHFAMARSFGPSWEKVLDYAALHPEKSVGRIRAAFLLQGESCEYSPPIHAIPPCGETEYDPELCEVSHIPASGAGAVTSSEFGEVSHNSRMLLNDALGRLLDQCLCARPVLEECASGDDEGILEAIDELRARIMRMANRIRGSG